MAKTQAYAALLRGINIGGHRRVPMADLGTLLTGLGHGDVRTYLQSGNAVFTSASGDADDTLARGIEKAVEAHFGFTVDCLVRAAPYLASVVADCPFPAAELEGRQLHVTYFSEHIDPQRFDSVDAPAFLPEEFRLGERALYLYAPHGLGRSKLAETLSRPRMTKGVIATTRNWNTVVKLAEMTGGSA
ncbi:DUF1697 domain-containing protein [Streptomyces sp. NBC_01619]|uniref:DUF1697 domain-containing protein n=1 Tax=Streptomyces pratisoli TaxID=3139917 RepID=A0ACC6QQI8_9ACTN|nr:MULTISPECIES: DUF1697 domain-containing protein [unclassified Streptomyces]MCX4514884.1 DUF1697 domain-containing protein [Streptomyces sp. NBC_01619]